MCIKEHQPTITIDNPTPPPAKSYIQTLIEEKNKLYTNSKNSVRGIIASWTDREWELFLTIPPFDVEEEMIISYDKWLNSALDAEDGVHLDLRKK